MVLQESNPSQAEGGWLYMSLIPARRRGFGPAGVYSQPGGGGLVLHESNPSQAEGGWFYRSLLPARRRGFGPTGV